MSDVVRLTRDKILNAQDIQKTTVVVPEWGGDLEVTGLSKAKQMELRQACKGPDGTVDNDKLELAMIITCTTDPVLEMSDLDALRQKSAAACDRVLLAIYGLNKETEASLKAAERTFSSGDSGV